MFNDVHFITLKVIIRHLCLFLTIIHRPILPTKVGFPSLFANNSYIVPAITNAMPTMNIPLWHIKQCQPSVAGWNNIFSQINSKKISVIRYNISNTDYSKLGQTFKVYKTPTTSNLTALWYHNKSFMLKILPNSKFIISSCLGTYNII